MRAWLPSLAGKCHWHAQRAPKAHSCGALYCAGWARKHALVEIDDEGRKVRIVQEVLLHVLRMLASAFEIG